MYILKWNDKTVDKFCTLNGIATACTEIPVITCHWDSNAINGAWVCLATEHKVLRNSRIFHTKADGFSVSQFANTAYMTKLYQNLLHKIGLKYWS